jgi:hypothetical protein
MSERDDAPDGKRSDAAGVGFKVAEERSVSERYASQLGGALPSLSPLTFRQYASSGDVTGVARYGLDWSS